MKLLETQEQFEQLLGKIPADEKEPLPRFTVVYFTASWCGACRSLNLKELEAAHPQVNWLKCDIDENDYGIFGKDSYVSIDNEITRLPSTTPIRGSIRSNNVVYYHTSKDFIEVYVDKLVDYCGIKKNKIRCPKGTYSVIDWGSFSDIERFYEFFYKDATIYLDRKKETFDRAISISKTKIKYRKS
jgi:thiol-disulfide isomerase/thioredoxin